MTAHPGRRRGRPRTDPGPPPVPGILTQADLASVLEVLTGIRATVEPPSTNRLILRRVSHRDDVRSGA